MSEICCLLTPYSLDKLVPFSPFSNHRINDSLSCIERTEQFQFVDMMETLFMTLQCSLCLSYQRWSGRRSMKFHLATSQVWANEHSMKCTALVTVPLKCKLTVSTRNSILDPRSFRESRIEYRGSSFDFRFSRFENQVSRIKFRVSRHSKNFLRISNRDFEETI